MSEFFSSALFFGVTLSLVTFWIGLLCKKKFRLPLFNPLLIAVILTIIVLLIFDVDYTTYNDSAKYLSYLLTPTTICLAIPLYEQLTILKKNIKAVLIGIGAGVLSSLGSILLLSAAFGLSHEQYLSLLPKSITSAIAVGLSEELGGVVALTAFGVTITGIFGNVIAESVLKLFRIEEPVAKGLACGTAAHAIGTAKAMEFGELEGAMSSLSIAVAGLMTVMAASIFANLL
ncbi:MAG: LrgB family protein [Lachnospiraceae bacterium]|nr:LrgB family protein [Lachnospiraceae bacterium]